MIDLRKHNKYEIKAINFLKSKIEKNSQTSYNDLMVHLYLQTEKWLKEYQILEHRNLYLLTDREIERRYYLKELIKIARNAYVMHKYKGERTL